LISHLSIFKGDFAFALDVVSDNDDARLVATALKLT